MLYPLYYVLAPSNTVYANWLRNADDDFKDSEFVSNRAIFDMARGAGKSIVLYLAFWESNPEYAEFVEEAKGWHANSATNIAAVVEQAKRKAEARNRAKYLTSPQPAEPRYLNGRSPIGSSIDWDDPAWDSRRTSVARDWIKPEAKPDPPKGPEVEARGVRKILVED